MIESNIYWNLKQNLLLSTNRSINSSLASIEVKRQTDHEFKNCRSCDPKDTHLTDWASDWKTGKTMALNDKNGGQNNTQIELRSASQPLRAITCSHWLLSQVFSSSMVTEGWSEWWSVMVNHKCLLLDSRLHWNEFLKSVINNFETK